MYPLADGSTSVRLSLYFGPGNPSHLGLVFSGGGNAPPTPERFPLFSATLGLPS